MFILNKDILDALELLTHKGFSKSKTIDLIARKNEKIKNINKNLINKNVLLIDETGDILFDIMKYKPKKINYHLKNTFSKYYIELKIIFMKKYNYANYIKFFVKTKTNDTLFDYETYYKVSGYLTETTRLFWDALYENTNYNGIEIRNSDLFEQKTYEVDKYIEEKDFNIIKNNIDGIEINYIDKIEYEAYDYFVINNNLDKMYENIIDLNLCKKILF